MTVQERLPDPDTLRDDQLRGWHCACCGGRLFASRPIGAVQVTGPYGPETVELRACAPSCDQADGRRRREAWLEHTRHCWGCRYPDGETCPQGRALYAAYRAAQAPSGTP